MQRFIGKHLLIILLTIALGGAISIAAVPSLRGPVTDYIGENFGPKADVVSVANNNYTPSENPFYSFKTSSLVAKKGDGFTASVDVKREGVGSVTLNLPGCYKVSEISFSPNTVTNYDATTHKQIYRITAGSTVGYIAQAGNNPTGLNTPVPDGNNVCSITWEAGNLGTTAGGRYGTYNQNQLPIGTYSYSVTIKDDLINSYYSPGFGSFPTDRPTQFSVAGPNQSSHDPNAPMYNDPVECNVVDINSPKLMCDNDNNQVRINGQYVRCGDIPGSATMKDFPVNCKVNWESRFGGTSVRVSALDGLISGKVDASKSYANYNSQIITDTFKVEHLDSQLYTNQKIDSIAVNVSKGWVEVADNTDFNNATRFQSSTNPQTFTANNLVTDSNGNVKVYIRSGTEANCSVTAYTTINNQQIKATNSMSFWGPRVELSSDKSLIKPIKQDQSTINNADNIAIVKAKVYKYLSSNGWWYTNVNATNTDVSFTTTSGDVSYDYNLNNPAEKWTWQKGDKSVTVKTDQNGEIKFAIKTADINKITINAVIPTITSAVSLNYDKNHVYTNLEAFPLVVNVVSPLKPTLTPISYIRPDKDGKDTAPVSLLDQTDSTNADKNAAVVAGTNFLSGDKITFKASFKDISVDQNANTTVELPIPVDTPPTGSQDKPKPMLINPVIIKNTQSAYHYDQDKNKLVWEYSDTTLVNGINNQLKTNENVDEEFQLQVGADFNKYDFGTNGPVLKLSSQINDSTQPDQTKWQKSDEVDLNLDLIPPDLVSCVDDTQANKLNNRLSKIILTDSTTSKICSNLTTVKQFVPVSNTVDDNGQSISLNGLSEQVPNQATLNANIFKKDKDGVKPEDFGQMRLKLTPMTSGDSAITFSDPKSQTIFTSIANYWNKSTKILNNVSEKLSVKLTIPTGKDKKLAFVGKFAGYNPSTHQLELLITGGGPIGTGTDFDFNTKVSLGENSQTKFELNAAVTWGKGNKPDKNKQVSNPKSGLVFPVGGLVMQPELIDDPEPKVNENPTTMNIYAKYLPKPTITPISYTRSDKNGKSTTYSLLDSIDPTDTNKNAQVVANTKFLKDDFIDLQTSFVEPPTGDQDDSKVELPLPVSQDYINTVNPDKLKDSPTQLIYVPTLGDNVTYDDKNYKLVWDYSGANHLTEGQKVVQKFRLQVNPKWIDWEDSDSKDGVGIKTLSLQSQLVNSKLAEESYWVKSDATNITVKADIFSHDFTTTNEPFTINWDSLDNSSNVAITNPSYLKNLVSKFFSKANAENLNNSTGAGQSNGTVSLTENQSSYPMSVNDKGIFTINIQNNFNQDLLSKNIVVQLPPQLYVDEKDITPTSNEIKINQYEIGTIQKIIADDGKETINIPIKSITKDSNLKIILNNIELLTKISDLQSNVNEVRKNLNNFSNDSQFSSYLNNFSTSATNDFIFPDGLVNNSSSINNTISINSVFNSFRNINLGVVKNIFQGLFKTTLAQDFSENNSTGNDSPNCSNPESSIGTIHNYFAYALNAYARQNTVDYTKYYTQAKNLQSACESANATNFNQKYSQYNGIAVNLLTSLESSDPQKLAGAIVNYNVAVVQINSNLNLLPVIAPDLVLPNYLSFEVYNNNGDLINVNALLGNIPSGYYATQKYINKTFISVYNIKLYYTLNNDGVETKKYLNDQSFASDNNLGLKDNRENLQSSISTSAQLAMRKEEQIQLAVIQSKIFDNTKSFINNFKNISTSSDLVQINKSIDSQLADLVNVDQPKKGWVPSSKVNYDIIVNLDKYNFNVLAQMDNYKEIYYSQFFSLTRYGKKLNKSAISILPAPNVSSYSADLDKDLASSLSVNVAQPADKNFANNNKNLNTYIASVGATNAGVIDNLKKSVAINNNVQLSYYMSNNDNSVTTYNKSQIGVKTALADDSNTSNTTNVSFNNKPVTSMGDAKFDSSYTDPDGKKMRIIIPITTNFASNDNSANLNLTIDKLATEVISSKANGTINLERFIDKNNKDADQTVVVKGVNDVGTTFESDVKIKKEKVTEIKLPISTIKIINITDGSNVNNYVPGQDNVLYPGDTIKIGVTIPAVDDDINNVKLSLKNLPSDIATDPTNETINLKSGQQFYKEYEIKLNNSIDLKYKTVNITPQLSATSAASDLDNSQTVTQTGDMFKLDLWGQVHGQLTGPYNDKFQLVDDSTNQVLPYMNMCLIDSNDYKLDENNKIKVLDGKCQNELFNNTDMSNNSLALTNKNGEYIFKYKRTNINSKNEVKIVYEMKMYNPKFLNDNYFSGSDDILIEIAKYDLDHTYDGLALGITNHPSFTPAEIVTKVFNINPNKITYNDFKIRDNTELNFPYKIKKYNESQSYYGNVITSGLNEGTKTLQSVIKNIYNAMEITKKYYNPINFKTLVISNYGARASYITGKNIMLLDFPNYLTYTGKAETYLNLKNKHNPAELHEFTHYLEDVVGNNPYTKDNSDTIIGLNINCNHCVYANDKTGDSRLEAAAIYNQVILENILEGNSPDSWINVDAAGRYINDIQPVFGELYKNNKYIVNHLNQNGVGAAGEEENEFATVLNLLTVGVKNANNWYANTNQVPWFGDIISGKIGGVSYHSQTDIMKNYHDVLSIILSGNGNTIGEFYQSAKKIDNDWNQNYGNINGISMLDSLYALSGIFDEKNGNWKWDFNNNLQENIGNATNSIPFQAYYKPKDDSYYNVHTISSRNNRNFPAQIPNSYIKISNNDSGNQQDFNINVVFDENKNQGVKLYDENGIPINKDYSYTVSGKNNDILNLEPPDALYGSTIFITSPNSSDYIAIDNQKYWQAVETANTNDTGAGYIATANFNIQPADSEKGIEAATPPTLEQMQAMEAEKEKAKQAEIDKALAAKRAQEEADRLAQEQAQKQKDLEAQADAKAKADLQAQFDKLTQEIADANKRAQDAEEARLKALEDIKIAQQKELEAQAIELKAEQDKAIELAKLEADKQAEIEKNQRLVQENTKLQAQLASYEKQINDLQSQLAKTQSDLDNARIEKDNILNEKNKLIDDLSKAKEDNQVLRQISLNLRQSALSLSEQLKNLNIAYISQKESYQQDQLNNLLEKKNLLELTDINNDTKKQLQEQLSLTSNLTQQNSDLTNQIENQNDLIAKDQLTINQLQSDLNSSQDNLTKIQSQKADLLQQNNDLATKLQQAKDDHNIISQINLTLQKTVSDLQLKLKDAQIAQAERDEAARLQTISDQLAKDAQAQKDLADLKTQQELKAKELELQQSQTTKEVSIEQDKQDILNNESQNNIDKLDKDITTTQNNLQQITNQVNNAINDTPLINVKPINETSVQPVRDDVKIATTTDTTTHLSGITSETVTNKPLAVKTNDQIIVTTDNFKNTDNLTVYINNKQIAKTPIITPQTDLKITIPETNLGLHTITVKDDLGNQATQKIKVNQNKVWNQTNASYGFGTLIVLFLGIILSKILAGLLIL